ncbi:MAG: aminoglycoside 6-adenylyltransferase [Actinobacteria bacterium]|nr:aminoglycoside 6-adenylyltransferase [Actinomycetota bacterium]
MVLARLTEWAEREEAVRALVVTSGRAREDDTVDALSDYDVIAVLTDVERFDPEAAYGPPLARWGDEHDVHGVRTLFRGTLYEDWVKVDWSLWPVEAARLVAERGLTDDLDVGYRVLLDKDALAAGWPPASFRAHIPSPPTEAEYLAVVEEFWWSASYIGKSLWRGERFFSRFVLDVDIRHGVLRRMLEWLIEIDHDWSLRPGAYGRGMERLLPADVLADLEATYAVDGWEAFDRTAALFRRVARSVGDALGYAYPKRVDDIASARLAELR